MSNFSSPEATPEGIGIGEVEAPQYVRDLMVLNALEIDPADATVIVRTAEGSEGAVVRIPLVEIVYPDQNAVDDAILRSMGYAA